MLGIDVELEPGLYHFAESGDQALVLRAILAVTGVGLFSTDLLDGTLEWDATMAGIFGHTRQTYPRQVVEYVPLIHPDDRDRVIEVLAKERDAGESCEVEYRILRRDGEVRWVLCKAFAAGDERGPVTRMVGCLLDITERREVESRLARAQRMEALGQLAAGLAHNFNNALAAILPNVEMGLRHVGPGGQAALQHALDATEQGRGLTQQLMSLAGNPAPGASRVPVDLGQLAARVADMARSSLAGIPLELDVSPTGSVAGDPGELQQLVLNLLLNARDATDASVASPAPIRITVRAEKDGPASFACLEVADGGAGMDPATVSRIFEPFFTTKAARGGTGLGMFTAHRTVEQLGGSIEVTSAPGRGTRVRIRLPVAT